jgi:hypothetical protein
VVDGFRRSKRLVVLIMRDSAKEITPAALDEFRKSGPAQQKTRRFPARASAPRGSRGLKPKERCELSTRASRKCQTGFDKGSQNWRKHGVVHAFDRAGQQRYRYDIGVYPTRHSRYYRGERICVVYSDTRCPSNLLRNAAAAAMVKVTVSRGMIGGFPGV